MLKFLAFFYFIKMFIFANIDFFICINHLMKQKNIFKTLFLRKKLKDQSWFRYIMLLLHLWLGLLSSVVICIICLTGAIYAFKNQITDLYNYDKVFINAPKTEVNMDKIQLHFTQQGKELTQVFIPKSSNRSWIISYKDSEDIPHSTYFNPYSLQELGTGKGDLNGFFQTILSLHRNLLLGDFGRQIVGASVLIFVLMMFSGIVIWVPKKLKLLRQHLTIKTDANRQRINFDLHRVLGFYALIPLLIMAITGLYITYPWVKNGLITAMGGTSIHQNLEINDDSQNDDFERLMSDLLSQQEEKTIQTESLALSQIISQTQHYLPYEGDLSINFPNDNNPRYEIVKINSENWLTALLPDEISLDKKGELKAKNLFLEKPLHQQFTALARPLHTGEIIGLPSIILYFFASLSGFLLPITGIIMWWNRVKKQI